VALVPSTFELSGLLTGREGFGKALSTEGRNRVPKIMLEKEARPLLIDVSETKRLGSFGGGNNLTRGGPYRAASCGSDA